LRCYCDADFAGNAELGNARRSQHGYIILQGNAEQKEEGGMKRRRGRIG
jgi:hypothetical protein